MDIRIYCSALIRFPTPHEMSLPAQYKPGIGN